MSVRVSVAIMAVPERAEHVAGMVRRLSQQIGSARDVGLEVFGVEVFVDWEKRGPWHCWRGAWLSHDRYPSTHHAVIQDDVRFCDDFACVLARLAEARPGCPVSGFLPRKSTELAHTQGKSWVRTRRFLWNQCLLMPTDLGDSAVSWIDRHEGRGVALDGDWRRHDDVRLAAYFASRRIPVFVAVPHPVEHIGDELGSVMGHNGPPGKRRARVWIGEDAKGAHLPWGNLDYVSE